MTRPRQDGAPIFDPSTGLAPAQDRDGTPMVGLEPGTMRELLEGRRWFSPTRRTPVTPTSTSCEATDGAAVGVDLPYELLTGDMGDISDRTLRVLLNEFRRRIEQVQFSVYVYQLCRPVRVVAGYRVPQRSSRPAGLSGAAT
ncbi:phage portal protein [Pseudomonas aeruginosa]|nr:phage portal protein [Pseudomonas aeruginosa]